MKGMRTETGGGGDRQTDRPGELRRGEEGSRQQRGERDVIGEIYSSGCRREPLPYPILPPPSLRPSLAPVVTLKRTVGVLIAVLFNVTKKVPPKQSTQESLCTPRPRSVLSPPAQPFARKRYYYEALLEREDRERTEA